MSARSRRSSQRSPRSPQNKFEYFNPVYYQVDPAKIEEFFLRTDLEKMASAHHKLMKEQEKIMKQFLKHNVAESI